MVVAPAPSRGADYLEDVGDDGEDYLWIGVGGKRLSADRQTWHGSLCVCSTPADALSYI